MSRDSLAARLRAAFLDDLDEQLRTVDAELLALEREPGERERLHSLFRAAHTLKGAARAAGLPPVEQLCHALESLLADARDGSLALAAGHFRLLFAAADALARDGERLRAGAEPDAARLEALRRALESGELPEDPAPPAAGRGSLAEPEPATGAGKGEARVRVEADKLDDLLAATGQLLLAEGRVRRQVGELQEIADGALRWLTEWRALTRALHAQLERSGAAPATRALDRADEQIRRLLRDTARLAGELGGESRALAGAAREVADDVQRVRMRPFADLYEALPRAARDLAAASGKEVRLVLEGGDTEADRPVLDAVREALLHVVRNAVDHGIEPPAERARAGKPRAGTVRVAASLRGEVVRVRVEDDGRGLDLAAIRARLAREGRPAPASDREAAEALFEGGFSTRAEAGAISGRGVGLDAARAALERVRGSIEVEWREGGGTCFELACPLTRATIRALLVRVGEHTLALAMDGIEHLTRLDPAAVRRAEGRELLLTPAGPLPLASLARVLGPPLPERPRRPGHPVVVLRAGARRLALLVDDLVGEEEIVVRPLERAGASLPHLGGAAILASGAVALVLNAAAVLESGVRVTPFAPPAAEGEAGREARLRVLVVDDSITTRTLEQSTLEAAGYEVLTAVDGLDGWRILQERGASLVLSDVEMPGMDGFALCEAIRSSPRFRELPVVLVTSLEKPEHRLRGLEAGADAYVGKSGFDPRGLLDLVHQLIG